MIKLSCICGDVALRVASRPEYINECNCLLCGKSGARWSYFTPADVTVSGETQSFRRTDKDDPTAELHFCSRCGATTHFVLSESAIARMGNTMMGVNMALADESDLAGIELRFPDGRSWPGEGDFAYLRAPRVIGQD